MDYDKINDRVGFRDSDHTYTNLDTGVKYISVTTLIEKFGAEFDKDFWSGYKALERLLGKDSFDMEKKRLLDTKRIDISYYVRTYDLDELAFEAEKQNVLDEWQNENFKSCERGTKIHAGIENGFLDSGTCELRSYGLGGKFVVRSGDVPLDEEKGVYPEYLIHVDDGDLHLAGQIDLLIKDGNDLYIYDWKGLPLDTKIPTPTGWTTMGDLQEGDTVFDKNGMPTKVIHKSIIHHNDCYNIHFGNGDVITADCDHKWEVEVEYRAHSAHGATFEECHRIMDEVKHKTVVMTTAEMFMFLKNSIGLDKLSIMNPAPLQLPEIPVTGPKSLYELGTKLNDVGIDSTTYNKSFINSLSNYLRGSFKQRLDILNGIMDNSGWIERNEVYLHTTAQWICGVHVINNPNVWDFVEELLSSLGISFWYGKSDLHNNKIGRTYLFQNPPFNVFCNSQWKKAFECAKGQTGLLIDSISKCETVPTQCIEVDSPTHTYLCTEHMIVTHNTNKEIKLKGFYDKKKRTTEKMKYPLGELDECNFSHYTLQLSTYAWMLQHNNPDFNIKKLKLVHFDHNDKRTEYDVEYKKDLVERLMNYWKKQCKIEERKAKRLEIEF